MDITTTTAVTIGFVAAAVYSIAIRLILKRKNEFKVVSVDKCSLSKLPELKCPKCGNSMTDGFMSLIGPARWRDFDSVRGAFTGSGQKLKNLAPAEISLLITPGIPENIAKRCEACSLILVDHRTLYKVRH